MTKTNYLILLLNFYDNVMVKAFENSRITRAKLIKETVDNVFEEINLIMKVHLNSLNFIMRFTGNFTIFIQ